VRYLTIVRHAKAEKQAPRQRDVDRALTDRGRAQCEQLRAWALEPERLALYGPVVALVSSATRTRETFARAFDGTAFVSEVYFSDLLYNGVREVTAEDLLIDLAAVDPVTTSLLVVGHNPTVHEVVLTLAREAPASLVRDYPTGAACVLALSSDQPIGLARYEVVDQFVPD